MYDKSFPILLWCSLHYLLYLKIPYPKNINLNKNTKNSFKLAHNGLTITLKNPISFFAIISYLSKSFINGV